jgi:hypothetical protein
VIASCWNNNTSTNFFSAPLPNTANCLPAMSALRSPHRPSTNEAAPGAVRCPPPPLVSPDAVSSSHPRRRSKAVSNKPASSNTSHSQPRSEIRLLLSLPVACPLICSSEFATTATTLLAQKTACAEISYEAEVQQDDMPVGAVSLDLVGFLQEDAWGVRCVFYLAAFVLLWLMLDGREDRSRTRWRTTRCSTRAGSGARVDLRCAVLPSFP